ncbi:uncharacterized protein LOC116344295 isoform X2 [Contarinia nasturtii]|uniref:uncharacterized protein LOC116344295 isoform X1 n=1 Tax=Contarinia nasturtii TaxID=265458 RepID=UPI0012D39CD6|nr:uncharacterized protein LOC116344295 isoform X1 [Contarinia nasturtii]XP_031628630.1 uncharacterized protein LOC116344295 isoform X2 [Contarinia nasturtii]
MGRLGAFTVCLILAIAMNSSEFSAESLDSNIVQDLSTLWNEDKAVVALYPLIKEKLSDNESTKLQINYRLGNRIAGDRLVATAAGSNSWTSAQDIKLTLNYPKTGIGSIVTYLQVIVEQSTNIGRGYVTSGGIGQRQITVVIEGNQTLYFKYNAEIYGY